MDKEFTKYDLPKGWAFATIGDLIGAKGIFVDGDWIETKDQNPNGDIRLIQLADIGDCEFRDKSSRYMTHKNAILLNCTFLQKGDILIARMPEPLGRACLFPYDHNEKFVTIVDVAIIRLANENINRKYVMYCINSPSIRKAIESLQTGTTRQRISRGNLSTINLPIPPYNEQYRIVEKIEELFSELEHGKETLIKIKSQLILYRNIVLKSAFEGILTMRWRKEFYNDNQVNWKDNETNLGNLGELISGQHIMEEDYNNEGAGIPYLTGPSDFGDVYPKCSRWSIQPKVIALPDDILITVKGSGVGKINMMNFKGAIGRQLMAFRSYFKNKWFIYYYLLYKSKDINNLSTGSAIPGLSRNSLLSLNCPIVDEEEQDQIVQEIEYHFTIIEHLKTTIRTNLAKVEALRYSILQKAFEGQLVSQDTNDEPASALLLKIKEEKEKYLLHQKTTIKEKAPKVKIMDTKRTILEILQNAETPLAAKDVWEQSKYKDDIELFYSELKKVRNQVSEVEKGILALNHENR